MAKISIKNTAFAIHEYLGNKTGADLENAYRNVSKFLKNKKLLSKSDEVLQELGKLIDEKEGIVRVKVKSAYTVPEHKQKEIEENIKNRYKTKGVKSEYTIDENLLGGVRLEVGEEVQDNTYRNKLNQLEKILINK